MEYDDSLWVLAPAASIPPRRAASYDTAVPLSKSGEAPMPKTRQPRPQPNRTIRMVCPPRADGVAVVCITLGKETSFYTLCEIPCEVGGRGFAMHRTGLGTLYHVRIGAPEECSCECLGYLRHGYCRHVLGLLALVRAGRL
jgi:hypothetical protein